MTDGVTPAVPDLPTTAWAVLGMLSHADELSGYDLKKWADWSLQFFYWSPSFSQIYAELKRLEKHGYATSRTVAHEDGVRGKRMYAITPEGRAAAANWVNHAPVEAPVLKHSVMLRAWGGGGGGAGRGGGGRPPHRTDATPKASTGRAPPAPPAAGT
ncbi:PadR family transcriptional regulator, partial [Nocardia abscessus]|uniref:PadR family transcriptional regulator n=1 Tax=Nocardia abscessus TaxID=120957 RepID=UPI002454D90D